MFKSLAYKTYHVGGSVRDQLMGKTPKDFDYVVENTTETEFVATFPESKKVGDSFPVFLVEGNEVALARTEKSTGSAYTEFDFVAGVSIEEDLGRRDFTINSMAINVVTNTLVDPYNGQYDLKHGILRSINEDAFQDDPLRIIRGFRFAVRYDFEIEDVTFLKMAQNTHLLANIKPERIELEIRKMYEQTSVAPSDFFRLIDRIGGLKYIGFAQFEKAQTVLAGKPEHHPEGSTFNHLMEAFDYAWANNFPYHVAIASLLHDLGKIESEAPPRHVGHELKIEVLDEFFSNHRFSADVVELSRVVFRNHMTVHDLEKIKKPVKLIRFFKRIPKHYRADFFKAVNSDSVLNENQLVIIQNLYRTFAETKIDIPKTVLDRGKESIVTYVEAQYAEKYKEVSK